jgi:hypothetical protein
MTDNAQMFLGKCMFNKELLELAKMDLPAAIAEAGVELSETEREMVVDALDRAGDSMKVVCDALSGQTGDDITSSALPDREQTPGFTGVTGV